MDNEFERIKFEKDVRPERKYRLPDENIIVLDKDSKIRQRNLLCRQGLSEGGIDWPVEIQGGGLTDPKAKEFTVAYPQGDFFASWAVTIHELGHLRQPERHGKNTLDEIPEEIDTENDAWELGRKRFREFAPEVLEDLERKFREEKEKGKLGLFLNFSNFLDYFKEQMTATAQITGNLPEDIDPFSKEAGLIMAKKIKLSQELWDFYTNQAKWKVGENIDKKEVENAIKKIAKKVAEEICNKE